MGGAVAITLREPDGTVHKMCRWTGILPWWVVNTKMYQADPAHLQAFVQDWQDLVDDYQAHRDDQNFTYRDSKSLAPHGHLAPHWYGLVVIDLQERLILSSQGYTGFDYVLGGDLMGHLMDGTPTEAMLANEDSVLSRIKTLADAGYVCGAEIQRDWMAEDPKASYSETVDLTGQSFNQILELIEANRPEMSRTELKRLEAQMRVDYDAPEAVYMPPWGWVDACKLAHFNAVSAQDLHIPKDRISPFLINSPLPIETFDAERVEQAQAFKARVLELGFELDASDEAAWTEWLEEKAAIEAELRAQDAAVNESTEEDT